MSETDYEEHYEPAPLADRYQLAWQNARARARVLSGELTRRAPLLGEYAQAAIKAEQRAAAMERGMQSTAADALKHRGCHRELMAQCQRAEQAEAEAERLRPENARMRHELEVMYGGAFDKTPSAPADADLRERVAAAIAGVDVPGWPTMPCYEAADAVLAALPVGMSADIRKLVNRLVAHAKGFQDVLEESDRDPWARLVRADIDELRTAIATPSEPAVADLRTFLRGVIRDCPARYPDDIADRVLAALLTRYPFDAQAGLQRLADALRDHGMVHLGEQAPADEYDCCADAVLAILPAPADRAAVLGEAADGLAAYIDRYRAPSIASWSGAVAFLRRMADEAKTVAYRTSGARLFCVICARQESDTQPLTPAEVSDDTVCHFCGGRVLAIAAESVGAVVNRHFDDEQQAREA
ncbi:hypothetical protein ABZ953_06630 [Streptomyces sp. NPDC046465]|uniref:hypothetical protein n=1 Tax=Streptomyces sp. NPDC046465 TaxID=3155810 RepID=UPI0033E8E6A5